MGAPEQSEYRGGGQIAAGGYYAHAKSYANLNSHSLAYADAHSHTNPNPNPNANSDTNPNAYSNSHGSSRVLSGQQSATSCHWCESDGRDSDQFGGRGELG